MSHDIVIVGAGQGGAQAAIALRQQKYAGTVTLIGAEPDLPYERPLLSKEYLAGERTLEQMVLRDAAYWADKRVETRLGAKVTAVDAAKHAITLEDGTTLGYGTLVWATGGTPRRLACDGHDLAGVHAIRDRADVDRLKGELPAAKHVVVVGGGYIGLEAASVFRKLGHDVVLLEALDRVLGRVAGEPLSRFFEAEHRARGVDLRLGAQVACLEGDARVTGVRLAGGEVLPADVVIVGIGIEPAVGPLLAAGAEGALGGVRVDLHGRTSLPDVYASGDCAAHPLRWARGALVRLESIQNANDLSTMIAKSIAGTRKEGEQYDAVPWFWSNQYELRLQTVGLFHGFDDVVVRGDPAARTFSVVYLREGAVIAVDAVNLTKDYVQAKALIASARVVDRAKLADAAIPLKEL